MKETIRFTWLQQGRKHEKTVKREAVLSAFKGLVVGFEGDNEISLKLTEIIPYADEIHINKDYNATQDVPSICCKIDGEKECLKIMRHHKIVWSILEKYTTD